MVTHVAPQLRRIPQEQLQEEAIRSAKKLCMRVFEVWRKVLAREVVEDVHKEDHRLSNLSQVGGRWAGEEKRGGVHEELEERSGKARKNVVDLGEQGVGTRFCAPWSEDGMCSFQHTHIDLKVRLREGAYKFLRIRSV